MNSLHTALVVLSLVSLGAASSSRASITLFDVDLDYNLSNDGILSATINQSIELRFTEDVTADFVLVLRDAFTEPPSGGHTAEASPFSYERNGVEVLPTATEVEMGYFATTINVIVPGDFIFEIGNVSFAAGDTFTIFGATQSEEAWTGEVPPPRGFYSAFLTDAGGLPISGVEVIPEPHAIPLFLGLGTLLAVAYRRRGKSVTVKVLHSRQ